MEDKKWIALRSAEAILYRAGVSNPVFELRVSLQAGEVASRGVRQFHVTTSVVTAFDVETVTNHPNFIEPEAIPADRWSEWTFNLTRQSLDRPSRSIVATGFNQVKIARADVEALVRRLGEQPCGPKAANDEGEPAATADAETRRSGFMSAADRKDLLPKFLAQKRAEALATNRPFNEDAARQAANAYFGKRVTRKEFRPFFADAGGGAPRGRKSKNNVAE